MSLETVSIRLSKEQIKRAKEQAAREGTTLSQKLRWLVMTWLAKTETVEEQTRCTPTKTS